MSSPRTIAALLLASVFSCASLQAAVSVTIQPGQDGSSVVWSVTWNSLEGNFAFPVIDLGFIEPSTGQYHGNYLEYQRQVGWDNVGNYLGPYFTGAGDYAYVDGWYGVESDTSGWLICPAGSTGVELERFYFGNRDLGYEAPFPTSGAFTLTLPGGKISDYNPGTYTSNPNVTITVIPEPASLTLLGLGLTMAFTSRRRMTCIG